MYKNFFKRFIDIVVSLVALPFFLLSFVFIAPLIYFTDKGPVFYNAERVGKNGKVFKMYKFRSMKVNAPDIRNSDGSTYNGENDPRVTKIGKLLRKTSLDEIPQVLNVLVGDMSVIGPRPATPMILENITPLQSCRFQARPGITGYTQMKYRNSAQGDMRYEADKFYVDNISFLLDLKILFGSVKKVIMRENIYNDVVYNENVNVEAKEEVKA